MSDPNQIRRWMETYVENYVDGCDEVNATQMVEDWDASCGTGEETLDPNHIAWEIAAQVAEEYEDS